MCCCLLKTIIHRITSISMHAWIEHGRFMYGMKLSNSTYKTWKACCKFIHANGMNGISKSMAKLNIGICHKILIEFDDFSLYITHINNRNIFHTIEHMLVPIIIVMLSEWKECVNIYHTYAFVWKFKLIFFKSQFFFRSTFILYQKICVQFLSE